MILPRGPRNTWCGRCDKAGSTTGWCSTKVSTGAWGSNRNVGDSAWLKLCGGRQQQRELQYQYIHFLVHYKKYLWLTQLLTSILVIQSFSLIEIRNNTYLITGYKEAINIYDFDWSETLQIGIFKAKYFYPSLVLLMIANCHETILSRFLYQG